MSLTRRRLRRASRPPPERPLSASVLAGLATLAGPLHGGAPCTGASPGCVARGRWAPTKAVADWLAQGRPLPAFGHPLYPDGDPRALALLDHFKPHPALCRASRCGRSFYGGAAQCRLCDIGHGGRVPFAARSAVRSLCRGALRRLDRPYSGTTGDRKPNTPARTLHRPAARKQVSRGAPFPRGGGGVIAKQWRMMGALTGARWLRRFPLTFEICPWTAERQRMRYVSHVPSHLAPLDLRFVRPYLMGPPPAKRSCVSLGPARGKVISVPRLSRAAPTHARA